MQHNFVEELGPFTFMVMDLRKIQTKEESKSYYSALYSKTKL